MSSQSKYSSWNGECTVDCWLRGSTSSKQEVVTIPSNMLYASKAAFERDSITLPSASFYDESHATKRMTDLVVRNKHDLHISTNKPVHGDLVVRNKHDLRISTNKPLPALPKNKGPYFDYMFSDAEDDDQNDEEVHTATVKAEPLTFLNLLSPLPSNLSFHPDHAASLPQYQESDPIKSSHEPVLFGYDGKQIKQEGSDSPFDYVKFTARYSSLRFPPISPSVQTTDGTGPLFDDPSVDSDETEITGATAGFYGGYVIEESPSPYHAPNVDDDAGFGDIRDGCEHFPEQWTDSETRAEVTAPYKISESQASSKDCELSAPKATKSLLLPKSQIAKAARVCDMGLDFTHRASYTPRLTGLSGFNDEVVAQFNGTKRSAQDSISSASNENLEGEYHDNDHDDEEAQSNKKARHSSHDPVDADVVYAPMPSTFSLFPDLKHKSSTLSGSTETFHPIDNIGPTEAGYPGQFRALLPPSRLLRAKCMTPNRSEQVTFGTKAHANGLFHHTRFQPGGNTNFNEYSLDFSQSAVPTLDGPLGRALKIADEETLNAANNTGRTSEEDTLRRETHFECSLARLEGVAVGEYRYWQGHSSVEEYNQGGMCVCWKECFCTEMCGRYADMLCPCAKHIEFEE